MVFGVSQDKQALILYDRDDASLSIEVGSRPFHIITRLTFLGVPVLSCVSLGPFDRDKVLSVTSLFMA